MITVNSSGGALNPTYTTVVQSDNRKFLAKLLVSGVELDCAIARINVTKGSCGTTEAFSIGNIISNKLTAEVKGLDTNIKTSEVEVRIGLELTSSVGTSLVDSDGNKLVFSDGDSIGFEDAHYEWVTLGFFTITDATKTIHSTNIIGYGGVVSKTAGTFEPPETMTFANIASSIGTAMGCSVYFESGINTSALVEEPMLNISNYEALQILASLVGGYAVDTHDGNVFIHQFSNTPTLTVNSGLMNTLPQIEEVDFEVTGVVVQVRPETTDEDGEIVPAIQYPETPTGMENLIVENAYMTEEIYDNIFTDIVGYEYRPAFINQSLGDPRIEGNDVLSAEDADGNSYVVPCHYVSHTYDGGFRSEITAVKATVQENEIATAPPITKAINAIHIASVNAQNSAQIAIESANTISQTLVSVQADADEIRGLAEDAKADAEIAKGSASSAYSSATNALNQLSTVQNVVDVLNWATEHGDYVLSTDTEVVEGKWYFQLVDGEYQLVNNPTGNPSTSNYYEVTVDTAMSNYISSHLALTDEGLFVQMDDNDYRMQIASDGIYLWSADGVVASYSTSVTLGDVNGLHMILASGRLGFWQGSTEVAWISTNKLFIESAEVTNELRIGNFVWKPRSGRLTLQYSPQ